MTAPIEIANCSNPGQKRPQNEDSTASNTDLGLAILADGMGGYKAGEVASAIAVEKVTEVVSKGLKDARKSKSHGSGYSAETILLRKAVEQANAKIHQTAADQPQCEGMGTTVVACLYYDNRVSVAHVGDSRLYRVRGDRFEQVTLDHSLLQELVSRGFYTPEEARKSLNKNLVTRALGIEPTVKVDVQEDVMLPGEVHLLCSDGLSDMVEDEDIHLTISTFSANLEMAAQQLVRMANDNGGRDNVSVVLTKAVKSFGDKQGFFNRFMDWFA